jgi:hypothetical protein
MTLVQSWIDSLTLLKPKNAQLFIMVTLKSIIEAYKIMFWYFWMAPSLIYLSYFILGRFSMPYVTYVRYNSWEGIVLIALMNLFYQILLLAICFITRPSIMKKDWSYFCTQYKKIIIYWLLLPVLTGALVFVLAELFIIFYFRNAVFGHLWIIPTLMYWLLPPMLLGWSVFSVLFFADSAGGAKNFLCSMCNSLKMIIFNYPLLVVIGLCFYVPVWIISPFIDQRLVIGLESYITKNILGILLLPIGVCTYANIYIKKLHDQFDLYSKQA